MPITNYTINPKNYKLEGNEESIKNLKPYFEVSSSSYSSYSSVKKYVNGKLQEDQSYTKRDGKAHVDLNLRDANSGEVLGRGRIEYDPHSQKDSPFEEKIVLKNRLGNQIGSATVEMKPKSQGHMAIEEEDFGFGKSFNRMLRDSDRLFDNFFGGRRNRFGLGFFDDFEPMMMLEDEEEDCCRGKRCRKNKESKKHRVENQEKKKEVQNFVEEEITSIKKEKVPEEKPEFEITDE